MREFRLRIETDGAAFQRVPAGWRFEVAALLDEVGRFITKEYGYKKGAINDCFDNLVGEWEIVERKESCDSE